MPVYSFSFPASAAGRSVTVRDAAGEVVETGTAGSASSAHGPVVLSWTLPSGVYIAEAVDAALAYSARATGVLEVENSLTDATDIADRKSAIRDQITEVAALFQKPQAACIGRSGTSYLLYARMTGVYWMRVTLVPRTYTGGGAVTQIGGADVIIPATVGDDSVFTFTGTWATVGSVPDAYGGGYRRATASGATATYTTPAGVSTVLWNTVLANSSGLARVEIDDDRTRATQLPTAQSLVDAGTFPNTILTANGGTLNADDRVYDTYRSTTNFSSWVPLADDLAPGAHKVEIIATGYKRAAATDTRVSVSAVGYAIPAQSPSDSGVSSIVMKQAATSASAWESAFNYLPSGASAYEWVGNYHGYEFETSLTVTVDGTTTTVTDGQTVAVNESVEVARGSYYLHPETGTTRTAEVATTYRLDRHGFHVTVDTEWLVDATVRHAYIMMPVNGRSSTAGTDFDRGQTLTRFGDPFSFPGSADTYYGQNRAAAAWVWESDGPLAFMLYADDVIGFTNDFARAANRYTSIQDRNGELTKVYISRLAGVSTEPVPASTNWRQVGHYLWGYFASAEAVFA